MITKREWSLAAVIAAISIIGFYTLTGGSMPAFAVPPVSQAVTTCDPSNNGQCANVTSGNLSVSAQFVGNGNIGNNSDGVAAGTSNIGTSSYNYVWNGTTWDRQRGTANSGISVAPYGVNQTPITGNATGTTGAVVGTLAGTAGKTTYICGFDVDAIGGTAPVGPITVAGLIGSSQVYQGSSSAAGGSVAKQTFNPCIPASAVNTAITVTTTADGTATAVDVNSWGFQL